MKKTLSLIGMIGGIALIVLGLVVMFGGLGGETNTSSGAGAYYDSGYAAFGADFYTYVSNNAAEAASASRTAANNLDAVAKLLKNVGGLVVIAFGLFMTCFFGIVFADQKQPAPVPVAAEVPAPAPDPEPVAAEAPMPEPEPKPVPADIPAESAEEEHTPTP